MAVQAERSDQATFVQKDLFRKTDLICLAEFGQMGGCLFFKPLMLIELKRKVSLMEDHLHAQVAHGCATCKWTLKV